MASGGGTVNIGGNGVASGMNVNLQALQTFHQRCGRRITLSNGNRTASRSVRDFSHALVFSAEPLIDDVLFEVVIERKNHSWGGSIEIGVTSESPDKLELPSCATVMRNGTWVMSGIDVRKDGLCLTEFYGVDLETLNENDRVGVMRTSNNELVFYVNGESQGVAAVNMPKTLWALVDLYGRCVQVSICPTDGNGGCGDFSEELPQHSQQLVQNIDVDVTVTSSYTPNGGGHAATTLADAPPSLANSSILNLANFGATSTQISTSSPGGDYYDMNDRLRFHTRCGSLVKLSPNCRSAERRRPLDEFNNGVVMTHRPLKDNELFEIRIDKLVDKWSGSIEVGVTTHNPTVLHFPATMTNMRSGTIMMSGCGILTNGKGTRRQYGEFNLDELREGDRVGMMRKANGNLHYYINGQDQGVAATRVASTLWGVIDLYGMTIKVTIVDRDEREQQNLVTRRNNLISTNATAASVGGLQNVSANGSGLANSAAPTPVLSLLSPESEVAAMADSGHAGTANPSRNDDRLTFHPLCGSHATVTHSGRTALRPNASDDFNNGVVLTRRPLRPNELFQVRLERVVTKWAGSVEMGVTTHSAEELDFPFTMTNVRSGTWMMTGNGVMHNGITVIEQYGQNLDRLQVGDRVGVVRKDDGTLHFFVNGVDQGPAATNVPERVYGVIDLYGQAAQASIVDTSECNSPDTGNSTISNTTLYSETPLRFHSIHGKNASISNSGLTASRPNSLAEFNDAIVFSNRPLRQRELFEVCLEEVVRHWSGNIEIGVTGSRPEDIQLAANATEMDANDTIILCGPMIFHNRKKLRSNVLVDLDTLGTGARVGVMRNGDFIHFFIDGIDQGPACECRSPNVWGVIDLYGQCAQVSLTQAQATDMRAPYATSENSQSCQATSVIQPTTLETKHRWTCISGNVTLTQNWTVASRLTGASAALSRCVVFSEHPLSVGSPFEIKLVSHNPLFAGCLSIGITDLNLADDNVRKNIPLSIKRIPANVWYASGNEVRYNSTLLQRSMTSLEWLRVGDRIALELTPARTLKILLNSEDMNIQFQNVPNDVYVVVELQGSTMAVQVISSQGPTSPLRPFSLRLQDSLEFGVDPLNKQDSMLESIESEALVYEFSEICGKNIRLLEEHRSAMRSQSYNNGLVFVTKPLCKGESISIKIDSINSKWKGTIGLGVVGQCPQISSSGSALPPSIIQCKRPCWVATHDYINVNGQKIASKYGEALEHIQPGTVITMTLTHAGMLIIMVGSINLEDLTSGLSNHVYPVFDLYGKCERITIITGSDAARNGTPIVEESTALEIDSIDQDSSIPQCEKADLEVHEKETEQSISLNTQPTTTTAMNRSVMESVSENLLLNMSIKNRTLEQNRADPTSSSSSCCLQESLLLQHNTNLHIQLSQSTQRFYNALIGFDNSNSSGGASTSTAAAAVAAGGTSTASNPSMNSSNQLQNIDTNKEIEHHAEDINGAVGGFSPRDTTEVSAAAMVVSNNVRCASKDNLHELNEEANLALQQQQRQENETLDNNTNDNCAVESSANNLSIEITTANDSPSSSAVDVDEDCLVDVFNDRLLLLRQLHLQRRQEQQRLQQQFNLDNSSSSSAVVSNQFDSMQSIASIERKDCEYLKLVQEFRNSLVLPESFFQSTVEPICFCSHCNAQASEKLHGWVYFKLNQQTVNSNSSTQHALDGDMNGDWLPLFYMTRVDKIRAILDHGQPLPIDTNGEMHSHASGGSNQKDEPGTRLELHFTPNSTAIIPINQQYKYHFYGQIYQINTAFEVYVRRQSLCASSKSTLHEGGGKFHEERRSSTSDVDLAGCSTSSAGAGGNAGAANGASGGHHDLYAGPSTSLSSAPVIKDQTWFTKEAGACVITALILKLDKIGTSSSSASNTTMANTVANEHH
ncbi:neuralized-like protein 4 [Musca vetustissima]|uniref:neuralized-like protein 4 n=1 Tax=Musca vetustissima TaxID=27455 RepID=UPI002AB602B2|nr:neuralized-like protein 4 [Musca vetustissima]